MCWVYLKWQQKTTTKNKQKNQKLNYCDFCEITVRHVNNWPQSYPSKTPEWYVLSAQKIQALWLSVKLLDMSIVSNWLLSWLKCIWCLCRKSKLCDFDYFCEIARHVNNWLLSWLKCLCCLCRKSKHSYCDICEIARHVNSWLKCLCCLCRNSKLSYCEFCDIARHVNNWLVSWLKCLCRKSKLSYCDFCDIARHVNNWLVSWLKCLCCLCRKSKLSYCDFCAIAGHVNKWLLSWLKCLLSVQKIQDQLLWYLCNCWTCQQLTRELT